MAPVPTARQSNGFEPPPSSILATHVVHAHGVPDLDRDNFQQLLTEVLSTDEQGQPNLGTDITVNHKLICIICQVGIEPSLAEDPFKPAKVSGRANSQMKSCLEVLRLAIEKSPHVLFVKSDPQGRDQSDQSPPLYFWLLSRLLPLLASASSVGVRDDILSLIKTMVGSDRTSSPNENSEIILDFIRACISGRCLNSDMFLVSSRSC